MSLKFSYIITLFSLTIFISSLSTYGQIGDSSKVVNSEFPDSWDTNRDLRKRNGKILLWKHIKRGNYFEGKSCVTLVFGPDSTGSMEYFISKMYSNEKPFTKWNYGFIHYADYFIDSVTGMKFGFRDLHLQRYNHKPTEDELYNLLQKWNYSFFEKDSKTIEAGLDEKLWLGTFGFIPDRKRLSRIK